MFRFCKLFREFWSDLINSAKVSNLLKLEIPELEHAQLSLKKQNYFNLVIKGQMLQLGTYSKDCFGICHISFLKQILILSKAFC